MNMLMLDVTGVPSKEEDDDYYFGSKQSAADFAKKGETISYELLANLGPRVERVTHE